MAPNTIPGAASAGSKAATGAGLGRARNYRRLAFSTVKYLLRTEVHTFAFSVAANAILSFFPFVLLLMTLALRVFRSPAMYNVIKELLRDYLPAGQDFVIRNMSALASARNRVQVFSLVILLVTSTGVFLPLEVALNRVWRFPNNRSYLGNQLISLGLAFACGILALISIALSAGNVVLLHFLAFGHDFWLVRALGFLTAQDLRDHCQHGHLLSDLLGAAEWESSGAGGTAGGAHHGAAGGSAEILLLLGAAAAEFPGGLWAVLAFSQHDVLGVPTGVVAAYGSAFVGGENIFGAGVKRSIPIKKSLGLSSTGQYFR